MLRIRTVESVGDSTEQIDLFLISCFCDNYGHNCLATTSAAFAVPRTVALAVQELYEVYSQRFFVNLPARTKLASCNYFQAYKAQHIFIT
jgi:hypothetical protein